jgi:flagellar protein FliS
MNPYASYRKVTTETADPLELVVMLYRGAISFLNGAEKAMLARDIDQDIVAELMGTINLDAGEVAVNLMRLYDFMQQRLIKANLTKDPSYSAEVRAMLIELLETWDAIARSNRAMATTQRSYGAAIAVA